MILGARYPGILIAPFDHGIEMNESHPYSYIRALYNTLVCSGVGVLVAYTTDLQVSIISRIRAKANDSSTMNIILAVSAIAFAIVLFGLAGMTIQVLAAIIVIALVPLTVTYFVHYDEEENTLGLTAGTINIAREQFKGSAPNDAQGEDAIVNWKPIEGEYDVAKFSKNDMERMKASVGDLVYVSDKRSWMGGLKSCHTSFGEPHDEDGVVYLSTDLIENGLFVEGRVLKAEKEM